MSTFLHQKKLLTEKSQEEIKHQNSENSLAGLEEDNDSDVPIVFAPKMRSHQKFRKKMLQAEIM